MSRELINLLPPERIRAIRRDYFLRLATVALLFLSLLVIIHGIFLLPSYLYLSEQRTAEAAQLAAVDSDLASSTESGVNAQLSAISADATYLARLSNTASASAAIRAVLAVPRPGISISSITFTAPAANTTNGTMTLSGIADSREDLRAYDVALAALPFVSSANLPISAYAEDSNISFSVTLTGTLTP